MTTAVKCGTVSVEKIGDSHPKVYINLPGGVYVTFAQMRNIVYPDDEELDTHARIHSARHTHNTELVATIDNIIRSGRGCLDHFTGTNCDCDGGVSVTNYRGTVGMMRDNGLMFVKLNRHDTRCLLHSLRKFAELWAEAKDQSPAAVVLDAPPAL